MQLLSHDDSVSFYGRVTTCTGIQFTVLSDKGGSAVKIDTMKFLLSFFGLQNDIDSNKVQCIRCARVLIEITFQAEISNEQFKV